MRKALMAAAVLAGLGMTGIAWAASTVTFCWNDGHGISCASFRYLVD